MTNDNLKARIRAHMADHGVNYTTARRAILADTSAGASTNAPGSDWTYTPRTFTDPKVLTAVRRAYRKPHIKPFFQDMTDGTDTSGGESWGSDTLRRFPFLRDIEAATDRPSLRYCDPYDIMDSLIQEAYLDDADVEAERTGTTLPDKDTLDGHWARIGHVPESVEDPVYALDEAFEDGRLSIDDYEKALNTHLKKWPGSIHAWASLGGLYWVMTEDRRWTYPFSPAEKDDAIANALRAYSCGVAVAQRALPANTNAIVMWGWLDNRSFLRCLHGLVLCHYRNSNTTEATAIATDILWLNPHDNQGIRYILGDLLSGIRWEDATEPGH